MEQTSTYGANNRTILWNFNTIYICSQVCCDLLPYLSATTDRARAGNHCYGSYTVTLGGVPKYEHSSQRPKTTKLVSYRLRRAIHMDPSVLATTSTLTPVTLTNLSSTQRVPRVHPPSRAQLEGCHLSSTRGMLRA
ncbi:hypothetical protein DEO72_LG7g1254 [Vigna unguiculata]|uniref:Uncharacterized protein n=1 Tax=Vigna unguiculata TaxID=3917 RepID=A0A4D6MG29_VIGUN|nr:hypothetical protein DEO72_LG7g1254 [Vigna unguiculata]